MEKSRNESGQIVRTTATIMSQKWFCEVPTASTTKSRLGQSAALIKSGIVPWHCSQHSLGHWMCPPHHHQSGFSCPCYFALQASEKMSSWELVKPRSQAGTSLPCDGVRGTQVSGLLSFLLGSSLNRDPVQVLTQGVLRNPFGHWDQLN